LRLRRTGVSVRCERSFKGFSNKCQARVWRRIAILQKSFTGHFNARSRSAIPAHFQFKLNHWKRSIPFLTHYPTQNRFALLLEMLDLFFEALSCAKPLRTFAGNALA